MLNIQNVLKRLRPVSMLLLVYIVGCAPIYTERTNYPIGTGGDYPIGMGVGGVASQQSEVHTHSSTTYAPTPIFISPEEEFRYRRHYYSPHYRQDYYTSEPRVRKMRKAKKGRNRAHAKKRKTATSARQDQTLPKYVPKQAIGQRPAFPINRKPSQNVPQVIENRRSAFPINRKPSQNVPQVIENRRPALPINASKPSQNVPQVIENRQPALPINTPKQRYTSQPRKQSRQVSPQSVRRVQPVRRKQVQSRQVLPQSVRRTQPVRRAQPVRRVAPRQSEYNRKQQTKIRRAKRR